MSRSRFSWLLPKFLRSDKSSKSSKASDGVLDSKSPQVTVHFLDDSQHQMSIKGSWKGCQLLERVCDILVLHEKDYFGLRFIDSSGQTHWLDGSKSLSSQFKGCHNPYKLYFGVKFYAADPCKLREEITRYLFFLQVKRDILQGRLPVSFDEAAELCSFAVQSEIGDYDPRQHTPGYVSEFCFVPNQTEELEHRIAAIHRKLVGLLPVMAEYRFLDKVKWLDMYGVDLHPVSGEGGVDYFMGLTPTGIVVYKNKNKVGNYFWPRINKVTFHGKVFIVKVKDKNNEEHAYAFELARKTACKYLWKCCVEHHAFFRLNQNQERSAMQVRALKSLSSNRLSGRSERQAMSGQLSRQSSNVVRLPSRRQPRRMNSDSGLNVRDNYESQYNRDSGMVTMVMKPEPVRAPRHRSLPELQDHESPHNPKSAPWEVKNDFGLYTLAKESPNSARSDRMSQQRGRVVSGSDSESGISHRRRYFPNKRTSDNESDISVTRRRRREIDSDSASDVSSRYPASAGHVDKKGSFPVLYPFHDKENRPNGSIPSLHSAPAGESKQRRRRRRSRSPSKKPPEELMRHFEYGLKDTDGMSEEQLKDIPFINVETKNSGLSWKNSNKIRQKVRAAKQRSMGELDQNKNQILRRDNSAQIEDQSEKDMSVRSQPVGMHQTQSRTVVQHSRSFSRRPHSYHQSQFSSHSSTLLPSSSIINSHYSSPHLTQEASLFLSPYRQESSVTSKYQRPKSPDQMTDESCSTLKYEHHPTKVHDTASNVSYQSHHSHHHHNHHHQNPDRHSQYSHLTRSQGAYESDNNLRAPPRENTGQSHGSVQRSNNPKIGGYGSNHQSEVNSRKMRDDKDWGRESEYEQLHQPSYQHSASRSRDTSLQQNYMTPSSRSSAAHLTQKEQGYTSTLNRDSIYSNYAPMVTLQQGQRIDSSTLTKVSDPPYDERQGSASKYNSNMYAGSQHQHHNHVPKSQQKQDEGQGLRQGTRSGPYNKEESLRTRTLHSDDRSVRSGMSSYQVDAQRKQQSQSQTSHYSSTAPPRYQQEPPPYQSSVPDPHLTLPPSYQVTPPKYQSTASRWQDTPPRYPGSISQNQEAVVQSTPPKNSGAPLRYQGTPPKYQSTYSRSQGTPPQSQKDGGFLHSREQSEGGSSQASTGVGHLLTQSPRPSPAPTNSDRSGSRSLGSSLTSEMAQVLRAPVYSAELCTEI